MSVDDKPDDPNEEVIKGVEKPTYMDLTELDPPAEDSPDDSDESDDQNSGNS